jgi:molybdate transport system substrate-binding protein
MKYLGVLCVLFLSVACGDTLTIAAGAGYKKPVQEVLKLYEAKHEKVDAIYGNMAQIFAQAKQTDIAVLIADKKFLDKQKTLLFDAYLEIGEGKAVIAYAKGVTLERFEDLSNDAITRIAMPEAKKAIYGTAGEEFLQNAGLKEALGQKLLVVSTVPQVAAYVASHDVDAGIMNLTAALDNYDKIGGYVKIPQHYYTKIDIVAGATKACASNPTCHSFIDFLKTQEAKAIFEKYGL